MSGFGNIGTELLYASTAAATAKDTFTSEVTINNTGGMTPQAALPAGFFSPGKAASGVSRTIRIVARGIVSSTGTPSFTFTIRLGSAALATATGISSVPFYIEGDVTFEILGAAGALSTVRGIGTLLTDGYSATTTTRVFPLWGGAASPGTVATVDPAITNFVNFNVTCTASSGSNSVTLQQLLVYGLN